ncbi:MAG: hypothetical protein Q8R17_02910 [bacterium]|nr:hypothetical protein [bacterium]
MKSKTRVIVIDMTRNPIINALAAATYISTIGSVMYYAPKIEDHMQDVGALGPIAFISLFTLSAAVMGYCFLYTPLRLYIDGAKKEGGALFVNTILAFACITALMFGPLFFLFFR